MRIIWKEDDREILHLMSSSIVPAPRSLWILTDGKAGDTAQCAGVAEALAIPYEARIIAPRAPFSWWLPHGPIDPKERTNAPGSPLAPPLPDMVIASGRRAAGYLKHIKRASGGRTFTVMLKDPRSGPKAADLIWVPYHDPLRGANVLATPTSPHRFSVRKLADLRTEPVPALDSLTAPRVAVLVGGKSRHHRFTQTDQDRFVDGLKEMAQAHDARFMITISRRTPLPLAQRITEFARSGGHFFWDGEAPNPYGHLLAKADAIVATADSTNMIGEATATGRPIHVFHPNGGHPKITRFLGTLERLGCVHPFPGPLKTTTYEPIDSTPVIANWILSQYTAQKKSRNGSHQSDLPQPGPAGAGQTE